MFFFAQGLSAIWEALWVWRLVVRCHWVVVGITGHAGTCVWASRAADAGPAGRASRQLDRALSEKINENHEFSLLFNDFH